MHYIIKIITLFIVLSVSIVKGQNYSGKTLNKNNEAVSYVNIGVLLKNIGTVSDADGFFSLQLKPEYDNDTLMFSCIGYYPFKIKVSDFKQLNNKQIYLSQKVINLKETIIKAKAFKYRTLGVKASSKNIKTGVVATKGAECGILIKLNKPAMIQTLNLNIAECEYDTVFYRLNIYSVKGNDIDTNVLQSPIYITITKDQIKDFMSFDLKNYNIRVKGDFLITLEYVKDLGPGHIWFCSSLFHASYFRETSQAEWMSMPLGGFGLTVDVAMER